MDRRLFLQLISLAGAGTLLPTNSFLAQNLLANPLKASDFGRDFKWGVATAAYQIEGAHLLDGKGLSIWDEFTSKKGKIKNGENGNIACDFYHSYQSDLQLLKSLNMDVFRFSAAWSRILPEGTGKINQKGIDFYHKVIDSCLELGMEPWMTIYHWDLPAALQAKGGWENREILGWFNEYANVLTKNYGDKVKNWMVLNEPAAFTGVGYLIGYHAPGKRGFSHFLPAAHHAAMCQAEGGRIIRTNVKDANIGTTFSCSPVMPWKDEKRDGKSMERWDVMLNRLFIEPALGMGYPIESWPVLKRMEKHIQTGDLEKLAFDFDFIGVQNYTREIVKRNNLIPYMKGMEIKPKNRGVKETTEMGWEVYPEGIYKILKQFGAYKGIKKIYVTENGAAFPDKVENDRVHDEKRTQYYKDYLAQVLRAKNEGVNVAGYFCWTFLDNFEWSEGFYPRFGLVHVNFETQKRTIKDSGLWFKEFLKS
jgi:beta-glucosidase